MQNFAKDTALKRLAFGLLFVSLLGFIDASYLTVTHYVNITVPCTLTHGCDIILKSAYSEIFGIPLAAFGVLYYLAIFFGTYIFLETTKLKFLRLTALFTFGGVLVSSWLVYVQLGILHAICQYCMFSALSSLILCGLGLAVLKIAAPSPSPTAISPEPPAPQTP